MSLTASGFERSPAFGDALRRWKRRLLPAVLAMLERLAPPCRPGDYQAPPPEWFKYPPV